MSRSHPIFPFAVVPPHSSSKRPSVKAPHLYHVTILTSSHHMRVVIDLLHSNLVTLAHASPLTRPRGCELPPKKACWGIVGDRDISCRFLSTWGRCDRKSVKQDSKTGVCSPCPGRDAILKIAVFVVDAIATSTQLYPLLFNTKLRLKTQLLLKMRINSFTYSLNSYSYGAAHRRSFFHIKQVKINTGEEMSL